MALVLKKSSFVWICADFYPPNKSVSRETHSLPKVDSTLAQLHVASDHCAHGESQNFHRAQEIYGNGKPIGKTHCWNLPASMRALEITAVCTSHHFLACQGAKTDLETIERLNRRTLHVHRWTHSANQVSQAGTLSKETFCDIGLWKTS